MKLLKRFGASFQLFLGQKPSYTEESFKHYSFVDNYMWERLQTFTNRSKGHRTLLNANNKYFRFINKLHKFSTQTV